MSTSTGTRHQRAGRAAAFGGVLLALGACASPSATAPGGSPTGPVGGTLLQVTVDAADGTAPHVWTLSCDPAGGTHPQAAAACAQLAAAPGDPFAPTPKGMMCSMIFGGDQKATVTGTYRGRPVDTTFARTNGCEVARWQLVSQLLVVKGGAAAPGGSPAGAG
jgi:hypothetical protein